MENFLKIDKWVYPSIWDLRVANGIKSLMWLLSIFGVFTYEFIENGFLHYNLTNKAFPGLLVYHQILRIFDTFKVLNKNCFANYFIKGGTNSRPAPIVSAWSLVLTISIG